MKKQIITTFGIVVPIAALTTISCVGNQDTRYSIKGSSIGKTIHEHLLSYMGYETNSIVYHQSSIDEAIKSINEGENTYTLTTSQYIPLNSRSINKWDNDTLRTMTIAKDKVVMLINLPRVLGRMESQPIFDFEFISKNFNKPEILNDVNNWHQIIKNIDIDKDLKVDIPPMWLGRKGGSKNSGIAKKFHQYLQTFTPINKELTNNDNNQTHSQWATSNLFDNNEQLIEKVKTTNGAITYTSYAQAKMCLKRNDKQIDIYDLQNKDDTIKELIIPINFIYEISDEYVKNVASNLINQMFSPIFQEILAEKLFFTRLTSNEIGLQTNSQISQQKINLKTTDHQILEATKNNRNHQLYFGINN